ncbi:MAG TPA: SDR family NAD(P)-dependent oxidoreductase [Jiangellaceae bacterium]|nr:SDR family NAD(P)-dependent oxidoreductase [Jiangellaceae bacterium]
MTGEESEIVRRRATAMVTGGTSGIGAGFARALAAQGNHLVLVARDEERLAAAASELRGQYGVEVEVLTADLADREQALHVARRLEDDTQPIDTLVNNAGFGIHTLLTAEDSDRHEVALNVMCRSVLLLGGAAGRAMRRRGRGRIINVSSVAGFAALGSYSAVKAWVTSYSEGLSIELAGTGVQVIALCPGWVRTEFHGRAGIRTSRIPAALWLDVDDVVAQCLRDVRRGRVISIPSKRFRTLAWFARHGPRPIVRAVSARMSTSRRPRPSSTGGDR